MKILISAFAALAILMCAGCDRGAAKETRPTGEGDSRYYMPPVGLKIDDPVCNDASSRYVAVASQPQSHPDETMRQAARCTDPDLVLYVPEDQNGSAPPQMFVKVDTGRYLPVRTAEPVKQRGQDGGTSRGEMIAER